MRWRGDARLLRPENGFELEDWYESMSGATEKLPGFRKVRDGLSKGGEEERLLLRVVDAQESADRRIRQLIAAGLEPLEAIRIVQTDQAA